MPQLLIKSSDIYPDRISSKRLHFLSGYLAEISIMVCLPPEEEVIDKKFFEINVCLVVYLSNAAENDN